MQAADETPPKAPVRGRRAVVVADLRAAWTDLGDNDRAATADGRLWRRLVSRLHQRIGDESTLPAGGDRLQPMLQLADTLGAPYAMPEDPAAPPAQEPEPVEAPAPDAEDTVSAPAREPDENVTAPATAPRDTPPPAAERPREAQEPAPAAERDAAVPPQPSATADAGPDQPAADVPAAEQAAAPDDDPCPISLANSRRPYCQDTLADGSAGPPLVVLRAGTFDMGSRATDSEKPVRSVTISGPVAIARDETSVAEYRLFCTTTTVPCPEFAWDGDDFPVVSVSWDDARRYAEWLSEQSGFRYRLPSEAEWEYAARGGTTTPYSFGDEITPSAAHSSANGAVDAPLPRGSRAVNRNPYRLYHMSGNVREWVEDAWFPNHDGAPADGSAREGGADERRVVRGGSFSDPAAKLRSAAREPLGRERRDRVTGFRVLREIYSTSD